MREVEGALRPRPGPFGQRRSTPSRLAQRNAFVEGFVGELAPACAAVQAALVGLYLASTALRRPAASLGGPQQATVEPPLNLVSNWFGDVGAACRSAWRMDNVSCGRSLHSRWATQCRHC